MKSYKEVVKDRYGVRESKDGGDPRYSSEHPIGKYMLLRITSSIDRVLDQLQEQGLDMNKAKIIDIGCGEGNWTRHIAKRTKMPGNITGQDLSVVRLSKARELAPDIEYIEADIVEGVGVEEKYDVILAMDVFSHLNTQAQLDGALGNVFSMLLGNGYFIWYDIAARDHFNASEDAETSGFSLSQMQTMGGSAGFSLVRCQKVFKRVFGKHHTAYMAERFSPGMLGLLEKLAPGSPGNYLLTFKKA